jgi:hypothetical protein
MLSLFPQLLDYSLFGPTILRIGTGLYLLYLAYQVAWGSKKDMKEIFSYYPMFQPTWIFTSISTLLTLIIATLITVGLYTQVMAIIIILVGVKMIILEKLYGTKFGLHPSTHLLIILIQISLLIMGPGTVAFDLPL